MTITINGSGSITGLSAGGLPDATIQQADLTTGVAGTGPAFSAYMTNGSAIQSIGSATWTKIKLDTEEFDTNSNFDKDTNYRFLPTVAGYYQISGTSLINATSVNPIYIYIALYKNGTIYKRVMAYGNNSTNGGGIVSAVIYFNGSTDYVELYAYAAGGTGNFASYGIDTTYLTGALVRAA